MFPRAAISWSGGKDSYLALHRCRPDYDVVAMITMFTEDGARSRSHGLRPEVVEAQAARLGLRLVTGRGSWSAYEAGYRDALARVRALGVTHVIFGDIMGASNRAFPERVCAAEGLTCVEPLFGEPSAELFREFVATGADARMVTVRGGLLDSSWLGRRLTLDLLPQFATLGIDPCGELGEYHTLVLDGPLFSGGLDVRFTDRVPRRDCWALDVSLAGAEANAARR